MGAILLILLVLLFLGAFPAWPYARTWGYGPSGLMGVLLVILLMQIGLFCTVHFSHALDRYVPADSLAATQPAGDVKVGMLLKYVVVVGQVVDVRQAGTLGEQVAHGDFFRAFASGNEFANARVEAQLAFVD